jgi:DNA polymerase-4
VALNHLFVDFNSYFASVEQQDDPSLRGRPVGVVPVMAETTCCIAASHEAKRFGVGTGTLVREARRLCPDIVIVQARPARYVDLHKQLVAAINTCLSIDENRDVRSIDEMVGRLIGRERQRENAIAIARQIKRVVHEAGDWLRCSVGIAPNEFLAKTATDMQKPDGLIVLDLDDLPHALHHLELRDLCGIGPNMETRLRALGVDTVEQLCAAPKTLLRYAWNGIEGERFWAKLRGVDVPAPQTRTSSIGHSHVLGPELRTSAGADAVFKKLLLKAAARLRKHERMAAAMQIKLKYLGAEAWEVGAHFEATDDSRFLLQTLSVLLRRRRDTHTPLAAGVTLVDLSERKHTSGSLFTDEASAHRLNGVIDRINEKYGFNKVYFGSVQDALDAAPMRIPFNRLPDVGSEEEAEKNELWLKRIRQARVLAEAEHRRLEARRGVRR